MPARDAGLRWYMWGIGGYVRGVDADASRKGLKARNGRESRLRYRGICLGNRVDTPVSPSRGGAKGAIR